MFFWALSLFSIWTEKRTQNCVPNSKIPAAKDCAVKLVDGIRPTNRYILSWMFTVEVEKVSEPGNVVPRNLLGADDGLQMIYWVQKVSQKMFEVLKQV